MLGIEIRMDFSLGLAVSNMVGARARSGISKSFIFCDREVVYKGPYKQVDKRLSNVMARSQIFAAWKTPCVVAAIDTIETVDGIFVRFPNLMHGYPLQTELYQETFSKVTYPVVTNPPIMEVLQALPTHPWIYPLVEDLLVALCHCYIIGTGGMTLSNCLVDPTKQQFYIVNFGDHRTVEREDAMFYFTKPPSKKHGWAERVRGHYTRVAERLTPLLTDPFIISTNLSSRVERTIRLLHQHAGTPPLTLTNTPNPRESNPTPPLEPAPTPDPVPMEVEPALEKISISPGMVNVSRPEKINLLTDVSRMSQSSPLGQMTWKGLRGGATKTYSGLDLDVVKSALQKYIRRRMPEKAILAAIEMFRLGEIGGEAAVTNLFNRIVIIANEDIGAANPSLVLEITRVIESGVRDVYTLVAMIQLLAENTKTRMMSQAWKAYATPEGRAKAITMNLQIDTGFSEEDQRYINLHRTEDIFITSDPDTIRPFVLMFLKRLREKNFNAYSWAYYFLEHTKKLTLAKRRKFIDKSPRSMTGKADILLWKALSKVLPVETHDILVEAYFNHLESGPFLQHAILLAVSGVTTYTKFDLTPVITTWRQSDVIGRMLGGEFTLTIPPEEIAYIVDIHTMAGRKQGLGLKQFIEMGAHIVPQDPHFYNETLEQIYKQ